MKKGMLTKSKVHLVQKYDNYNTLRIQNIKHKITQLSRTTKDCIYTFKSSFHFLNLEKKH